ncbi:MAG: hypothetical protein K8T10_10795 [Candidatus Eremiobacteraeota bacterium]|nr:hypothetical protein [Candidatus Eremiobacteraeota bacterium]
MKNILKRNSINTLLLFATGAILIALFGKTSDLIGFATGIIAGLAAINLNIIFFGKFKLGSIPPVFYVGYFMLKLAIIGVIFYISMKAGGSPVYIAAGITCGIVSQVIAMLLPAKIN